MIVSACRVVEFRTGLTDRNRQELAGVYQSFRKECDAIIKKDKVKIRGMRFADCVALHDVAIRALARLNITESAGLKKFQVVDSDDTWENGREWRRDMAGVNIQLKPPINYGSETMIFFSLQNGVPAEAKATKPARATKARSKTTKSSR